MYQLTANTSVIREADGSVVPADPANIDWQDYQAWRAAGNQPAPCTPPVPSVPQSVTRLQAKAALLQAGLLDAANAHFAQAGADPLARLAWAEATTFERDSRLVAATAAALNLSSAQVDDLFRTASEINL